MDTVNTRAENTVRIKQIDLRLDFTLYHDETALEKLQLYLLEHTNARLAADEYRVVAAMFCAGAGRR
jgi:hypothetical protein